MSKFKGLKDFINLRLNAAVEEIFGHVERTVAEYEEEMNRRHHKLFDTGLAPPVELKGADVQQLVMVGEEFPPEQQDWRSSVDQEDPEPPHIKEEQEELWSSQEEADITTVPVKSEEDEEKPQSSQLHQRHAEHMETQAAGKYSGGPGPEPEPGPSTNSDPGPDTENEPKLPPGPDDSVDMEFWTETRQHKSGFTYRRNRRVSGSNGAHVAKKAAPGPKTDHRLDAGFYKQTKKPPSDPDHLRPEGRTTDLRALSHTLLPPEKPPSAENASSCSVCHGAFTDSESLVQHMRIHTRQTQFNCRICGEEFAWRRYLTKHMEVHKIYSCSTCDQGFAWHYQLKYHRCVGRQSSEHHHTEQNKEVAGPEPGSDRTSDPGPGTDEEPGDSSEPETDDSDDWKETREPQSGLNSLSNEGPPVSEEKPFSCSECGKRFSLKESLKRHLRTHTGEKPFSCPVCQKSYFERRDLLRHVRTHSREKSYSCSVCKESFSQSGDLRRHKRTHTVVKPSSCSACGKAFSETRTGERSCRVCDQRFSWLGDFQQLLVSPEEQQDWRSSVDQEDPEPPHIKEEQEERWSSQEEADITTVPVKSEEDEEKPQSSQLHQRHTEHMDSGGPGPEPDDKTEDFTEPDTDDSDGDWRGGRKSQSHLKSVQKFRVPISGDRCVTCVTDQNLSICTECGKRFSNKTNLKVHMLIHTREKPFGCTSCGRKFSEKQNLIRHMEHHKDKKPFSCSVCQRRFRYRGAVWIHKKTHSGDKVPESESLD